MSPEPAGCVEAPVDLPTLSSKVRVVLSISSVESEAFEIEGVESVNVDESGTLFVLARGAVTTTRWAFNRRQWYSYRWDYVEDATTGGPIL